MCAARAMDEIEYGGHSRDLYVEVSLIAGKTIRLRLFH
jgi:hypothetical protein